MLFFVLIILSLSLFVFHYVILCFFLYHLLLCYSLFSSFYHFLFLSFLMLFFFSSLYHILLLSFIMLFFVSSFYHLLIRCFIIAIYAQNSSRQSAVNNSRKSAPKLTYTSWLKLRSVVRSGWARNA